MSPETQATAGSSLWRRLHGNASDGSTSERDHDKPGPPRWSLGVLNDKGTVEVPAGFPVETPLTPGGSRRAVSSTPAQEEWLSSANPTDEPQGKKKTRDGTIILEPQPDDSANDPLNWPAWQRDLALLSLGFYCMVGGGITPIIAAGFQEVAAQYHVPVERVSLTTGLYMMGLGFGSVFASPTAILFGKRPVYLTSAIIFIGTALWAAWSPTFGSLLAARVFQGMAISPVECLPSATVAEIFFLHERAFRIGIYTLLLLSGKNLVPLVSAAIIQALGWHWTFWIFAMVVALGFVLLFLFVPETFWDRTPTRKPRRRPSLRRRSSSRHSVQAQPTATVDATSGHGSEAGQSPNATHPSPPPNVDSYTSRGNVDGGLATAPSRYESEDGQGNVKQPHETQQHRHHPKNLHVGFAEASDLEKQPQADAATPQQPLPLRAPGQAGLRQETFPATPSAGHASVEEAREPAPLSRVPTGRSSVSRPSSQMNGQGLEWPYAQGPAGTAQDLCAPPHPEKMVVADVAGPSSVKTRPKVRAYTHNLRQQPAKSFIQHMKPFHGRLNGDKWHKVMIRPFILFAYPSVLWSSAVYSCSIGWLIVISETLAMIYERKPYDFTPLQTGLVYVSPFIAGILGTAVAGRLSDVVVKAMSRRNGGLYEPEFRLVMAMPVLVTTCVGLMGFGWSAYDKDTWIVPTIFFGIVSFGCSMGSTTSITFCVDSYRQYAGEALVTLNFSKNVFNGLVFSLFITDWLEKDGAKSVFIWIGILQLLLMLCTIPMYIFGKRARMWTVKKNFMEKF